MATYTTYETIGNKEDISDIISNIAPAKVPFQTMCGTEKIDARIFQWQEDTLRAQAVNAKAEGADSTDVDRVPTALRTSYSHILSESFKISATADRVEKYGRAKETAYQLAKTGEELKRDLEHAMVGVTQAAVAGDNTGPVARKMASASAQIHANTTVAGGTAALTEAMVLSMQQKVYTEGGDASILMIKPADSLIVAGFTGASGRSRTINDGSKKLVNAVELYVSPFGEVKVVLNRFQLTSIALGLDPDMWNKCILRNWTREALAKVGDADRQFIVGEFSLKHKNWKASGLINALT